MKHNELMHICFSHHWLFCSAQSAADRGMVPVGSVVACHRAEQPGSAQMDDVAIPQVQYIILYQDHSSNVCTSNQLRR